MEEGTGPSVKDLDEAVEAFMKRQAELESGGTFSPADSCQHHLAFEVRMWTIPWDVV